MRTFYSPGSCGPRSLAHSFAQIAFVIGCIAVTLAVLGATRDPSQTGNRAGPRISPAAERT